MNSKAKLLFILLLLTHYTNAQSLIVNDSLLFYTGKNSNNQSVNIAQCKGNILLVEFWASWDIPSRKHHIELVKTYQNYMDKKFKNARKFTVISISLDINPKHHKLALAKDVIPWKNVLCDYKGWESPWVDLFKIKLLPQNFLFDANSKIIANNVWDDELEKQLKALQ